MWVAVSSRNSRSEYPGPECHMIACCSFPWVPALRALPAGMTVMAIIESKIDPTSDAFQANRRDMLALIDEFRALEATRAPHLERRSCRCSRSAAS